tara:strand:- start:100 stop:348 length:249 start_codon:yes stop_codon:yes gene_type:complete
MNSQSWSQELDVYDIGSWYDNYNTDDTDDTYNSNEQFNEDVIEFHIIATVVLGFIGCSYTCKYFYKKYKNKYKNNKELLTAS